MLLAEIAAASHRVGALAWSTGAQLAGTISADVRELGVDAYAMLRARSGCAVPGARRASYVRCVRITKLSPTKSAIS